MRINYKKLKEMYHFHDDAISSIKEVKKMNYYIRKKYNISEGHANHLIERASEYNPKDRRDAYRIIDTMYRYGGRSYQGD